MALLGSGDVWLADGIEMLTGWLMLVIVTVMVSEMDLPTSMTTALRTICCASIQSVNVASVRPSLAFACSSAVLALPDRKEAAFSSGIFPVYSVTGTPPMVPVPTWCTDVAAASIWDWTSGPLPVAAPMNWLRSIPVLLLAVATERDIHGLLTCNSWVR